MHKMTPTLNYSVLGVVHTKYAIVSPQPFISFRKTASPMKPQHT